MRLELINTRSTILPRSQFALHHHMFRERDSNHASTEPKSIVLPLDDPGMEPDYARRFVGHVGEGRIEHPRHLSTAFTERPAWRIHLRTTLRNICSPSKAMRAK